MTGVYVYKVTGPRTRRYVARLTSLDIDAFLEACTRYYDRGRSYYLEGDFNIFDAEHNTRVFGVVIGGPNVDGYCGLCGERAEFIRAALVCPCCHNVVGGV